MNDLKFTFRQLLKNPGFTAVAVFSLALGIGVNAMIFTFINALLLRAPEGVHEPDRLLSLWNLNSGSDTSLNTAYQFSFPDYVYYREHSQSFSGLLAYGSDGVHASWSRGGQAEMRYGQLVSGNYFSVLGVQAVLGRTFSAEEDKTRSLNPVVVLSHNFWIHSLGADPKIIGSTLTLNGRSFAVIGVAPAGFSGLLPGFGTDFWVPLMMTDHLAEASLLDNPTGLWLFVTGRLRPEVTPSQAQAELATLAAQLERANPDTHKNRSVIAVPATLLPVMFRGYAMVGSAVLMAAVGLVLLIACANAANLLLARAAVRGREMAVRAALGARRGRLIRQALTESTLVALLGGVVGLVLAVWVAPLLLALKPPVIPITLELPIDAQVIGFTLGLSLLSGLIFGIVPALRASKIDVAVNLKEGTQAGGYIKSRLRSVLVVGQVAVCLVLLISAGLCVLSLRNARAIDIGFDPKSALAASMDLRTLSYSETQGRLLHKQMIERVESLPGVQSATLVSHLPLGTGFIGLGVGIDGHEPPAGSGAFFTGARWVGPKYFETMGTLLLRGRSFSEEESERGAAVVIINDAMARRFWADEDPLGKRIDLDPPRRKMAEIVGVAKTGKYRSLGEEPRMFMYLPFSYMARATLVVRAAADPASMLGTVRREVLALDPNLALVQLGTLEAHLAFSLFPARASGTVLAALGLLALALALVGLYGMIAFFVSQRTREIGIRMALGAENSNVVMPIVRHGLTMTLIGISIGLAGALAATRVLSSLLYGIGPTDPLTFVGACLLLLGVAGLACFIPARRAARVDPMVALRYE